MTTHIGHLHIIGLCIFISKISIKMIRRYGGKYTSQFINLIFNRLGYCLNHLLRNFDEYPNDPHKIPS